MTAGERDDDSIVAAQNEVYRDNLKDADPELGTAKIHELVLGILSLKLRPQNCHPSLDRQSLILILEKPDDFPILG
jgi:hypothetical protein